MKAGVSIGIADMIIPKEKQIELDNAYKQVAQVEKQYRRGIITDGERYNKVIDIWTHAGEEIANVMFRTLEHNEGRKELNPVYPHGRLRRPRQSPAGEAARRHARPHGQAGRLDHRAPDHLELPRGSDRARVLHLHARRPQGSRRYRAQDGRFRLPHPQARRLRPGRHHHRATTAARPTASSFARSTRATKKSSISRPASSAAPAARRSRIRSPARRSSRSNQLIDEVTAHAIDNIGVEQLKIRSGLTCESKRGVCAKCYGRNLATGQLVKIGEAVGIIAAQSIGEPGTQLTMRTFHVGGIASQTFKQPIIKAKNDGDVRFNDLRAVQSLEGDWIALNKNGTISIHAKDGRELERYNIVIGTVITVADGGAGEEGRGLRAVGSAQCADSDREDRARWSSAT